MTARIALLTAILACRLHGVVAPLSDPADATRSFPLVAGNVVAPIVLPAAAPEVVRIAAGDFAADIGRVTGRRPDVLEAPPSRVPTPVVRLVLSPALAGEWEAFRISATSDTLTIAGSDRRGLTFGIYEMSRRIGVSPWHWWADVPVAKRPDIHLSSGIDPIERPAVKYRGIFLNDEGWGLRPWASTTYEPEVGNMGPKTYSRIFELLLRLRANTLWPAMHPGTTPFHAMPGNADAADRYAIVLGSSHAEPMLRNNVGEWTFPGREFNYLTHRDQVRGYWEERVKQRTRGESIFTLGMRGIHDSPIVGPKNQDERIATLTHIFAGQRAMLAKHLGNGGAATVPQMFCPYKEVLDDYNAGLQVPADVTIVWPDDNFGYIRRFGNTEERARPGGLGVYYHASYLGAPMSWLWIDTLPPALVWAEMTRAYEQGARTLWIVNVGDIKNTERSTEFFLDLAWKADRTDTGAPARFLRETAARDFGGEHAEGVADLLTRLHSINFARKSEHLQWHLPLTPYRPTTLHEREIHERLAACAALLRDSGALEQKLPPAARDAYFQLAGYPVGVTVAANERYFRAELARADAARGRPPEKNESAAAEADREIARLTARYNEEIAGGKWKHIVTAQGVARKDWVRFQPEAESKAPLPTEDNVCPPAPPAPGELPRPDGARAGDFVERDKVVSIHAGHFSARTDLASGAGWRVIPGLGRTGNAVTVLPSTADLAGSAPSLGYRFHTTTAGTATLRVRLLPSHPIVPGRGLRLAIAIDDSPPLPLAVTHGFEPKSAGWQERVLSNATEATAVLPAPLKPGWHTLRLIAVDSGVVVDRITLEFGGLPPSYDGPVETRIE